MAKLPVTELAVRAANAGMDIMSAYGCEMDDDRQRFIRDGRILTIVAGTSQIEGTAIAGRLWL